MGTRILHEGQRHHRRSVFCAGFGIWLPVTDCPSAASMGGGCGFQAIVPGLPTKGLMAATFREGGGYPRVTVALHHNPVTTLVHGVDVQARHALLGRISTLAGTNTLEPRVPGRRRTVTSASITARCVIREASKNA